MNNKKSAIDFDAQQIYLEKIKPLENQILALCEEYSIPFLIISATARQNLGTTLEGISHNPYPIRDVLIDVLADIAKNTDPDEPQPKSSH